MKQEPMYVIPKFETCPTHGSTHKPGGQCWLCEHGYEWSDLDKNLHPKPSAVRRVERLRARATDPATSHEGVSRIRETFWGNRRRILALAFPAEGLNYRQIAEQADIYPTTCSRVITTMVRETSLIRVGKDRGGFLYLPGTASTGSVGE